MIPPGVEVRPELQMRSDVLAFGFSGERVADQVAGRLLGGDFFDYLVTVAESAPTGHVVVDLRNVDSLSSTGFKPLLALQKKLAQVGWKLAVLISDPITREVFSAAHLDRLFLVAVNEAELRDLVTAGTPPPGQSLQEEPPEFSDRELAEMEASGITLDDAIRVIEGLRR
jgi:anti-anti-sigma factor